MSKLKQLAPRMPTKIKLQWKNGRPRGLSFFCKVYIDELPKIPVSMEVLRSDNKKITWNVRANWGGWIVFVNGLTGPAEFKSIADAKTAGNHFALQAHLLRDFIHTVIQGDKKVEMIVRDQMGDEYVDQVLATPTMAKLAAKTTE